MTYKQKMETEHPTVDSNYLLFSCPGHYIPGGPTLDVLRCPRNQGAKCVDCWNQEITESNTEIPNQDSSEKTQLDVVKISGRAVEVYKTFRERFSPDHSIELTKIVISAEVQHEMSKM